MQRSGFSIVENVDATTVNGTTVVSIASKPIQPNIGQCIFVTDAELVAYATTGFVPQPGAAYVFQPTSDRSFPILTAGMLAQNLIQNGQYLVFYALNPTGNQITIQTGGAGQISTGLVSGNLGANTTVTYLIYRSGSNTFVLNMPSGY